MRLHTLLLNNILHALNCFSTFWGTSFNILMEMFLHFILSDVHHEKSHDVKIFVFYAEPQIVVLKAEEYRAFSSSFMEVAEDDTAQLCVTVWGPLTETVHVLVETTDSGLALGEL